MMLSILIWVAAAYAFIILGCCLILVGLVDSIGRELALLQGKLLQVVTARPSGGGATEGLLFPGVQQLAERGGAPREAVFHVPSNLYSWARPADDDDSTV